MRGIRVADRTVPIQEDQPVVSPLPHLIAACFGVSSLLALLVYLPAAEASFVRSLALYTSAYACYLIVMGMLPRVRGIGNYTLWFLAMTPFTVVVAAQPVFSDDVYRYLWEGRAWILGVNPFEIPPSVAGADDPFGRLVNHPTLTAIYPALFQMVMVAVSSIWYSLAAWKSVLLVTHALACFGMVRVLPRLGRSPALVLAYAWNPLVVLESGAMGHLDLIPATLVVWACYHCCVVPQARGAAAWFVGVAGALKYTPFLLAPLVMRRLRHGVYIALPLVVAVGFAHWLAPFTTPLSMLRSLSVYASTWEFNSPLYYAGLALGGSKGLVRGALGIGMILGAVVTASRSSKVESWLCVVLAWILLSPAIHPWYLVWVAVFLPFVSSLSAAYLCWAVFLAYHVLPEYRLGGEWREAGEILWLEWGTLILVRSYELVGKRTAPGR